MRTFFFIALLVFAFFIFASTSMANVDLTPNTPYTVSEPVISAEPAAAAPQVVQIQDNTTTVQQTTNPVVPVTGTATCSNPYIVQAGDSLSIIAARCGLTVGQIRLANPQITNVNLIYSGQQITIPGAVVQQPGTVPLPVTGGKDDFTFVPTPTTSAGSTVPLPVTGNVNVIQTGTVLQVTGQNFPPNIPVNIGLGPQGGSYSIIAAGATDATGTVVVNINLPNISDPNTAWVVVMASAVNPAIQGLSDPFYLRAQ